MNGPDADVASSELAAASNVLNISVYGDVPEIDSARALTGLPGVITLHWYTRLSVRNIPVVCASHAVAAIQDRANQTVTIHNGVDIERFRPGKCGSTGRFVVARLCRPAKSSKVFPQIAEMLLAERSDIELWLIGEEGPSSDRVKYLGLRNDVDEILRCVDVVIHTPNARQGAHDLAVLEAMATGLPVVAFDVECTRESFPNSEVGILVPHNDVSAATRRVVELLDNADLRERMGRAARKLVEERFTIRHTAARYRRIYHALISKKSVGGLID